jgi:heme-degrading monooxygenase HmoA
MLYVRLQHDYSVFLGSRRMKGFVIMESLKDSQESIVLTLWETKGDMDSFYQPDNKVLANFVESSKILFEEMPERNDYVVSSFKI